MLYAGVQQMIEESGADMERYAIKSVAFGGFDKEDVARYIEQLSQETEALREERDTLREQLKQAELSSGELTDQVESLTADKAQLEAEVQRLLPFETEAAALKAQLDALRPDAEAHAMLRERVGAIECDARKRAADMEEQSAERMRCAVDLFRAQYQTMMNAFGSASTQMTSELRKLEVMLAQLPRNMDQTGAELEQLAAVLEKNSRSGQA